MVTLPPRSLILPRATRVLLVDDEPEVLAGVRRILRAAEPDWVVITANNGKKALERLAEEQVDVLVTDLNMPEMDGFQLLQRVERSHPEIIRVVHSSHEGMLTTDLVRYRAHNVLKKPTTPGEMIALLRRAARAAGAVKRHSVASAR
jgi:YesN/AraC family two-component response regulator